MNKITQVIIEIPKERNVKFLLLKGKPDAYK